MRPVTSWDQLPLVLHVEHMADLLDVARATIWKRVQADRRAIAAGKTPTRMRPAPESYDRSQLHWYRDKVRAHFERNPVAPARTSGRRKPFQQATDLRLAKEQLQRAAAS